MIVLGRVIDDKSKRQWYKWHPDKEEIIDLIEDGTSPQDITRMLRDRYPTNPENWIEHALLYEFRNKEYPDLAEEKRKDRYQLRKITKSGTGDKVVMEKDGPKIAKEEDISTKIMRLTGQNPRPQVAKKDFTDEQLLAWVNGLEGFKRFCEDATVERGNPVTLQDYQEEIAKLFIESDRVCVCTGGQVGKDFIMQEFILWESITKAGWFSVVLCATQSQAVALMNRILSCIKASEDLYQAYSRTAMKPDPVIYFKNGSKCLFLTAKSLVAGHTALNRVYVNEARDINEDEITRVSPLLGVGGGKLFVLSRPRFRRGYFWDCYSNPVFKTIKIPTRRNKYYDKKALETDMATMSRDLIKIEYEAEFADAGSSYISESAIKKAAHAEYEYKSMVADPDYNYCLGIDWARLRDTCVLIVLGKHKKEERYKIFHIHSFDPEGGNSGGMSSFSTQFAYINLLDNTFQFKSIIPESSGMGIPLCEALIKEWREVGKPSGIIKPYENRSLGTKLTMYDELKRIIENEVIDIPRQASRLVNELMMVQFGTTIQGALKLETPITDDFSDCLALSCMGFAKMFRPGVAVINTRMNNIDVFN